MRWAKSSAPIASRPSLLRLDDLEGFYEARKAALLALVENATGKGAIISEERVAEDEVEEEAIGV